MTKMVSKELKKKLMLKKKKTCMMITTWKITQTNRQQEENYSNKSTNQFQKQHLLPQGVEMTVKLTLLSSSRPFPFKIDKFRLK